MAARKKAPNAEAAQSGDRRRALEVLRDSLAQQLDEAGGSGVYAQLAAQYRATLADLDAMGKGKVLSASERFAARVADANPAI